MVWTVEVFYYLEDVDIANLFREHLGVAEHSKLLPFILTQVIVR